MVTDYHPMTLMKDMYRPSPMDRRRLVLCTCICLAIAGTLTLWAISTKETPLRVGPGDLEDVEPGTLVTVEGTVAGEPLHGGDFTVLELEDGVGGRAPVLLSFPTGPLPPGTELRITGHVALYKGRHEVVVYSDEHLVVLGRADSPEVDLMDLTMEPWRFQGMEPRVRVALLIAPTADLNGEDWWCLVADPSGNDGSGVLVLVRPPVDVEGWEVGDERYLKVVVRYDGSSGFVYLEVTDVA